MNIAIAGKSGFIGRAISEKLEKSHNVYSVPREISYEGGEDLLSLVERSDVIINLAGENILKRWTARNREKIYNSRIIISGNIAKAVILAHKKPRLYISASATGIYDNEIIQYEDSYSYAQKGFIPRLIKIWEQEAQNISQHGVRTVILRFGVVIGKNGGAMNKIVPLFKLGLGSCISHGKQPFPFIHIDDVVDAIDFLINNKNSNGVYNMVAPQIISNHKFSRTLSILLKKPCYFKIPIFLLRIIYGGAFRLLVYTAKVKPKKLIDEGFVFKYPHIKEALKAVI